MSTPATIEISGGEALAKLMELSGLPYMFGMGGYQILPYYDALSRQENPSPRHLLVSDERSGAFMADGFARLSGRPGLCDGTMGPGATNLVNGLIESYHAGIPVVAVVGDSNRMHSCKNMTQETYQREVLSPIVKEYISVEVATRLPELVRRAFLVATSGRPGPVILSVPEMVMHGVYSFDASEFYIPGHVLSAPAYRTAPDPAQVSKAAAMIAKAKRPVLLVGGGIHLSGAQGELALLAEEFNLPVAYTISGKGCLADGHPLCTHLFGRYDRYANELITQSDLLVGVGFKFGEIATSRYSLIPKSTPVIHIDILPEELGRHQPVAVGLWSDAKLALAALRAEMSDSAARQKKARADYAAKLLTMERQWQQANHDRLHSTESPMNMGRVCHELSRAMPPGAVLLADGGFAAHWTALLYDTPSAGRSFMANRGNAAIGYGVPGGIGAQLAAGERPVAAITGDGGLNMSLGDLELLVRAKVPLTVLVVNNAASGYVKALQHSMYHRYQSSNLTDLNYARLFKEMGGDSVRVEDPDLLGGALAEGLAERDGPVLIDMVTTRNPEYMLPAADARTKVAHPKPKLKAA